MSSALWGWIDRLKSRTRADNLLDQIHEAIYEGRPIGTAGDMPAMEMLRRQRTAPAQLNLAQSMVDTLLSRLGKRRPMPVISADDAGWSEKLFAKRASRVLRRKMGQPFVERIKPMVLRDALIRGSAALYAFRERGDVRVERVARHELVVDPRDAQYGEPRVMARIKLVPRELLAAMFPEHADAIKNANGAERDTWSVHDYETTMDSDLVEVAVGWHLPSDLPDEDGNHDGVCATCIRGVEPFMVRPWKRPRFPFAFMHWSPPTRGFWARGLVESVVGIQSKINDMLTDAQVAAAFAGKLKLFQQKQANINKNHLRATSTAVIETDGPMPQYLDATPQVQHQLALIDKLIAWAYEFTGISQASASSKSPLGSNASGKALDTMYDIESDRYSNPELNYAMLSVDIGQAILDVAQDIAEDEDTSESEKAEWITECDWRKVEVDSGPYHLALEPQNFIPESRAGRLAWVKEMGESGLLVDQMRAIAQFDEPDINKMYRHLLGPYRAMEKILEMLADTDVPLSECTPDPYIIESAGPLAKQMTVGEYDYAFAEDAGDYVLERYRWFLKMLEGEEEMVAPALAPSAAPPGPPMGAPPMDPMMAGMAPQGAPPMPMPPAPMPPPGLMAA